MAKVSSTTFTPGDSICLKSGDIWNESLILNGAGTASSPITLTSYNAGNKPKIRYGGSDVIYLENTGGWVIKGLEVECTSIDSYIKGGPGNGGIRLNYAAAGHWSDIVIDNNLVYGQGIDTNTSGITISAVFQSGKDDEVLNNITITNNTVYNVGVIGIATNAWDLAADNNLTSNKLFKNASIKSNTVYNTACQGIYIMAANNSYVERNLVHDCGLYSGIGGTGWGPVGIMTIAVSNIDVMFNEIYNMKNGGTGYEDGIGYDGTGIDIDWSSNAVNVQYNYCYNNQGNGIDTMSCTSSKILNNKVKGNGITNQGSGQLAMTDLQCDPVIGSFKGVKDLELANNLVYVDVANTTGISSKTYYGTSATWSGDNFHNNNVIIQNTSGTKNYDLASNTLLGLANNNRFYNVNAAFTGAAYGTSYSTLPSWRTGTGLDSNSNTYTSESIVPTNATNLSATSDRANNRISLLWVAGSDSGSGIWHYNIYRSTSPNFTPSYLNMVGESMNTSFYDTIELVASTTYYYKVEAEDMCGNVGTTPAIASVIY